MKILVDTYSNTSSLHHAYLIEGNAEAVREELFDFIETTMGIGRENNPDFRHEVVVNFGIGDSRVLKELHAARPVHESGKRIVVIETTSMTREAQNALLKVFEEPLPGNHFFIIMPRTEGILPTLRSRVQFIMHVPKGGVSGGSGKGAKDAQSGQYDELYRAAKEFMSASPKARMDMIAGFIKKIENEEYNRSHMAEFVSEIEKLLHAKGKFAHLGRLEQLRSYITDRSSSVKMILEYVAILLES